MCAGWGVGGMHVCIASSVPGVCMLLRLDRVTEDVANLRLQVKELYPLQLSLSLCLCVCVWEGRGGALVALDSQPGRMKMSGSWQKLSGHRQKL